MTYIKGLFPLFTYAVVLTTAILIGVLLDRVNTSQFQSDQRLVLLEQTFALQATLEREINEKLLLTEGVMAAIAARPDINQGDFTRSVTQLVRYTDNVVNVAAAPDLVVRYVYPFAENRSVIGLDLRERPDLMGAVQEAIDTRRTQIDGPIDLLQGGRGYVTRTAVFLDYFGFAEERLWGVVSLVINAEGLFLSAGLSDDLLPHSFALRDDEGEVIWGDERVLTMSPVSTFIEGPGITWTLHTVPRGGWIDAPPNRARLWMTVIFVALAVLGIVRAFQRVFTQKETAETQLEEAIDVLSDAFALYDADNRLVLCNRMYRELYPEAVDIMTPGRPFEDILRRGVEIGRYPEAEGREEEWLAERVEAQGNPGSMMEQQLSDGRWLRLEERRTPSGGVAGLRVDVTELKQALERSEAANAAKTDFLNTVSHELRTPLSVILGYNAFLKKPDQLPSYRKLEEQFVSDDGDAVAGHLAMFREDVKKFSKRIDVASNHLMALIGGILDHAAIEEGTLQLQTEKLDLAEFLTDLVEQLRVEASRKGLELTLDNNAGDVSADPVRLKQVFLNVIGNAIKFTEKGSIAIATSVSAGETIVTVTDTGTGIAPEKIDLIFDRFRQVDASSSRKHGGVGLGLAIAKDLIELHGGTISVSSVEGEGSEFRIVLPSAQS